MVASGTAINSVWQIMPNMSIRSSSASTSRKTRVAGQNLPTNLRKHGSSGRSSMLSALLLGTTKCGPKGGHNHLCAAKRKCSGRLRHKRGAAAVTRDVRYSQPPFKTNLLPKGLSSSGPGTVPWVSDSMRAESCSTQGSVLKVAQWGDVRERRLYRFSPEKRLQSTLPPSSDGSDLAADPF